MTLLAVIFVANGNSTLYSAASAGHNLTQLCPSVLLAIIVLMLKRASRYEIGPPCISCAMTVIGTLADARGPGLPKRRKIRPNV